MTPSPNSAAERRSEEKRTFWPLWRPWLCPWFLLEGALAYALGAGMAHYLRDVDGARFWLGQLSVWWTQLMVLFLAGAFDLPLPRGVERPPVLPWGEGVQARRRALWAALALLAAQVFTLAALLWAGAPWVGVLTLALLAGLGVAYAAPPLRLAHSGYGELAAALAVGGLIPWAAFTLQWGGWHRFLGLLLVPLMSLYLAVQLAREFPAYAWEQRHGVRNLLQRVDGQRGVLLHHLFLGSGFLFLALDLLAGLPWAVGAPALLGLLPAVGEIWLLEGIAQGRKPLWPALRRLSAATFALTVYLLAVGFWMT